MRSNVIQVRPIRTEQDHDAATARIAELIGARPGTPEGDELDVLATLVDAWEEKNSPIAAPDPIAVIEFRMDQQGLKRSGLEPMIGSRARVSEVLTGKRRLSLGMIRRLRDALGIPADLLIETLPAPGGRRTAEKRVARASTRRRKKSRQTEQRAGRAASSR